ncbi:MAG: hypothetical protein Greene041614_1040 [Parcubacteria group bacterium Greene0416_14]|nr:MAG: hypothetical protein Greene041614_1040 [Parcubacteria group bacterium Greene0416_14]TSD08093.1 MAG: hypothetical protein Greene07144_412 [Parcubacteria group bacterium Greene0714_4]
MKKDFKKWHSQKAEVNDKQSRVFFHEREIWFCHLGENIGFEQDGRGKEFLRPVIILKKFNNEIFWGIPLTKMKKQNEQFYFVFTFNEGIETTAILSQIRLVDAKRLKYKIGDVNQKNFGSLKAKIRQLLV